MNTKEYVEALKNDLGLRLHAQSIVANERLLRVVDKLTQEIATIKASPNEVSHPVRKRAGNGVWACSHCMKSVPMKDGKPKYPRCPYCGLRYSARWTSEARAIDSAEV